MRVITKSHTPNPQPGAHGEVAFVHFLFDPSARRNKRTSFSSVGSQCNCPLANGSMSSDPSSEGDTRRAMIAAGAEDGMIAPPGQLFYSTQFPACLRLLARYKNTGNGWRSERGEVLFIDAWNYGRMVDRTRKGPIDAETGVTADARNCAD